MTVARVITQQSAENAAYVRGLLRRKQPAFSEALELALTLAELTCLKCRADEHWSTRSPVARLSAAASRQSRVVASPAALET
jgi:hypothetical protein